MKTVWVQSANEGSEPFPVNVDENSFVANLKKVIVTEKKELNETVVVHHIGEGNNATQKVLSLLQSNAKDPWDNAAFPIKFTESDGKFHVSVIVFIAFNIY